MSIMGTAKCIAIAYMITKASLIAKAYWQLIKVMCTDSLTFHETSIKSWKIAIPQTSIPKHLPVFRWSLQSEHLLVVHARACQRYIRIRLSHMTSCQSRHTDSMVMYMSKWIVQPIALENPLKPSSSRIVLRIA